MSEFVDHVATLTAYRDRDLLDTTLAGVIRDLLHPAEVAIYRCVGEVGDERWLTRARLVDADSAAGVDPAWAEPDQLPRVVDHLARLECLIDAAATEIPGEPHVSIFPVASDREVVGVLEMHTAHRLDESQQRVVSGLLRVYQNFLAVLDYGERDTLTGLLNRKTFDDSFLKIMAPVSGARAMIDPRRVTGASARHFLGLIDIDLFKRVNDTFGHVIGDEVLLLMARLLRSSFRSHDRLYRFGGEEFVVLLRCHSDTDAAAAFERLRINVQNFRFPQVGQVTVSVGYTDVREGDSPSAALQRADQAAYFAKRHGRNQVAGHALLMQAGRLAPMPRAEGVELY